MLQSKNSNNTRSYLQGRVSYWQLQYNTKFWRAPIGRNRSHNAIVSLPSGHLSAHRAPFLANLAQMLALYNNNNRFLLSQVLCMIGSLGEHQISSGNLSHDSALDRRTLLFK